MKLKILNSISFRISFLSIIFTILVLIIMGLTIHQHVISHFSTQNKNQIEGKLQLIENLLLKKPNEFQESLNKALIGHDNLIVQIQTQSKQILYQTRHHKIDILNFEDTKTSPLVSWNNDNNTYQGIIVKRPLIIDNSPQEVEIIVAMEVSDNFQFLHFFKQQLVLIGIFGTLALLCLGWLATWHGLKPIRQMAIIAENISANNLSKRIELKNTPSELIPLAAAFNDMLLRLEISVEKLSSFSSDLAHEIRTPINNLMMQTQVSLTKPRNIEEYREVLFSNLEEYERLAKMVSDMLFLAKTDHLIELKNLQNIELSNEIIALYEFYEAWASEKNIQLKYYGYAKVIADSSMIRRAFSNLISNAIKYGEPNSILHIELNQNQEGCRILVKNKVSSDMQNLSQDQLNRFFDRFYRLDFARQRTEDGTGLGLAITRSIFELHHALISVQLKQQFIVFEIQFPPYVE
ncbi:heavy metal sensor histidine kinase [Acinetobacter sp. UBA6720]|uniref:heavy metal sensor histidine kinase n=1 Tax=Acinetobacter sp. UBA6720 TaxID=1945953 RepID=UPI0025C52265|nr:heavy metal sensor histidine kinase [Acinetobacter sp. UBA6720]